MIDLKPSSRGRLRMLVHDVMMWAERGRRSASTQELWRFWSFVPSAEPREDKEQEK